MAFWIKVNIRRSCIIFSLPVGIYCRCVTGFSRSLSFLFRPIVVFLLPPLATTRLPIVSLFYLTHSFWSFSPFGRIVHGIVARYIGFFRIDSSIIFVRRCLSRFIFVIFTWCRECFLKAVVTLIIYDLLQVLLDLSGVSSFSDVVVPPNKSNYVGPPRVIRSWVGSRSPSDCMIVDYGVPILFPSGTRLEPLPFLRFRSSENIINVLFE